MTGEMKKRRIGFSVLDILLVVLAAICILSAVFQDQIHALFGEDAGVWVEYTFLIENVTEEARNNPSAGEELLAAENLGSIGYLKSVEGKRSVFQSLENRDDQVAILTLTCRAEVEAQETDAGYRVSGVVLRPGEMVSVVTPSATFRMTITMVKALEN